MNERWLKKIQDYLNGKMNREERKLFESEMASNEELSSVFKLYQAFETEMSDQAKNSFQVAALTKSLENLNRRYFTNDLQQETEEEVNQHDLKESRRVISTEAAFGKTRIIQLWKSIAIAASLIGLFVLGVIWYQQIIKNNLEVATHQNSMDTSVNLHQSDSFLKGIPLEDREDQTKLEAEKPAQEQIAIQEKNRKASKEVNQKRLANEKIEALYAENFQPDSLPTRKAGPLQRAFLYYESGAYEDAITAIEKVNIELVTRGNGSDKQLAIFYMHYYKGLSYLAIGNTAAAIPELEKALARSPNALSKGKSLWYLSLVYLKTGKVDKAKILLNQLVYDQQFGIYQKYAVKLTDELKMNSLY